MGNQSDEFDALERRLNEPRAAKPREKGLGVLSAPTGLMRESEEIREAHRRVEDLLKNAGAPRMIKRTQLRKSPYQTKKITPKDIAKLAENLRHNALTTPIVVREISPGVFEIIAGHTRDEAFGVLGRDEIPGIVVTMSDEEAEAAVFYDNFFPPDTSDYEKYLGLAQVKKRHGYTQEALAERSGISRQLVGYLLAFERLPEAANEVLAENPRLIGATLAGKLAALPQKSAAKIVEGLQKVSAGELTQAKLLDWVNGKLAPKRPEPTVFKSGKTVFAKVLRREGRLLIDFVDEDDAMAIEKEIATVLKSRAAAKK